MSSIILNVGVSEGVTGLLRYLLDSGKVDGVLTTRRIPGSTSFDLALITDSSNLSEADPLAPVMTVNAGQPLSSISLSGKKLAAVLKPCELRAFCERVKREQGSFENLLTISYTCGGVFPLEKVTAGQIEELMPGYRETVSTGGIPDGTRETCRICEHFIPINSDVTVSVAGQQDLDGKCVMYLNSAKAEAFTEGFDGERNGQEFDPAPLENTLAARKSGKNDLFASMSETSGGLDGLLDLFGKCIGCHGCSRICPICYCLLCDFESSNFDYSTSDCEEYISRKGALRLPPDTILFHLGRLTHMSFSCVGCGMCSDVCPVDIPVAAVFSKTGEKTSALFDYLPGGDVEEPVPVMVFREEELSEFG